MFKAVQALTDAVHVLLQSVPLPHERKESIQLLIGDVRAELAKIAPPASPTRSFEVNERPQELGGGWKLSLFEGAVEVGGGVFPPEVDAYVNALQEGEDFLSAGAEA